MAKRRKPYDPGAAARLAQERREREAEAARMAAQGAVVRRDASGRIISAWRTNVFNVLLSRGSITTNQHDAAYRLAQDWAAWKRLDGAPEQTAERVDGQAQQTGKSLVSDRMLIARNRVLAAMSALNLPQCLVMEALMVATVEEDRPMEWRGLVKRATGVSGKTEQRELVVGALDALRDHYEGHQPQHRVAA